MLTTNKWSQLLKRCEYGKCSRYSNKRYPKQESTNVTRHHFLLGPASSIRSLNTRPLLNIPIVGNFIKTLGLGPKPRPVPTKEQFETMPDKEKYIWALVGKRLVSPWDSSETLTNALFRELISKDHLEAKYSYATMIMTGTISGDIKEAIKLWEECSKVGHSWAKANLAQSYLEGRGVPRNIERGLVLLKEAWFAKSPLSEGHAHTSALNLYALYLKLGQPDQAMLWLRIAAAEGEDTLAQYQLGHAYNFGNHGLQQDLILAEQYTRYAADKGMVLAQHNLACLHYEGGQGLPQNYEVAAYYFTKAHYQQYFWSTLNLASMYVTGKGVPQNTPTARLLLADVLQNGSDEQKTAAQDVMLNADKADRNEAINEVTTRIRAPSNPTNGPTNATNGPTNPL